MNIEVSARTHNNAELAGKFLDALRDVCGEKDLADSYSAEIFSNGRHVRVDDDTLAFLLWDEIFDALNDYAPEGTYFGAHPDDGASFGFWSIEEGEI